MAGTWEGIRRGEALRQEGKLEQTLQGQEEQGKTGVRQEGAVPAAAMTKTGYSGGHRWVSTVTTDWAQ